MQILEAKNMEPTYTYTTDFEDNVNGGAFDLPSTCNPQLTRVKPYNPMKRSAEQYYTLLAQGLF